jgi:hypothetical protein
MVCQSACDLTHCTMGEFDFFLLCIYITSIIMTCTTVYHGYRAGRLKHDHRLMSAVNKTGHQCADFLKPSLKRAILHWVLRSSIIMRVLDSYLILELFSWFPQAPCGTSSQAMPTSFHIPSNFLVAYNRFVRLYIIIVFESGAKWTTNKYRVPLLSPQKRRQPFLHRKLALAAASRDRCGGHGDQRYSINFFFVSIWYVAAPYTYLLQCSRVLLEKLTGSKLVKKFPALYGTRRFINRVFQVPDRSMQSVHLIPLSEGPS